MKRIPDAAWGRGQCHDGGLHGGTVVVLCSFLYIMKLKIVTHDIGK